MILEKRGTWGQGELYELLVLMVIGTCIWFIGAGFGVFDRFGRFAIQHDLMNFVMLSGCMGLGAVVGDGSQVVSAAKGYRGPHRRRSARRTDRAARCFDGAGQSSVVP